MKIGTGPNEVPINAFLNDMAYQDADGVNIGGGVIGGKTVAEIANGYVVKSANFQAKVGSSYMLTATIAATLPTASLRVGDSVKFAKTSNATPMIQTADGSLITTPVGSDTQVIFDINAELVFVFNGTNWEV